METNITAAATTNNATKITYTCPGDGSTTTFPILWPYIDKAFVKVSIRHNPRDEIAEDITDFITWLSDDQIEILPAPISGSSVIITRKTPNDRPLAIFRDGSTQLGEDLNTVSTQLIHISQESTDFTEQVYDYVGKAEGYLEKLEGLDTALQRAEEAAETAIEHSNQIMNLSIAVDDAPHGHMASGLYNPKTGMLTLRVPEGKQGEQGIQGPMGTTPYADVIDCGAAVETQITTIDGGNASFVRGRRPDAII